MTDRIRLVTRNAGTFVGTWYRRHTRGTPRRLPVLLAFLTDRCNLQCSMCGVYEHDPNPQRELSTDRWREVIDSAASLGTTIISFTGGEPLLRDDLFELIAHARGRGIAVHLCSNGTVIDETRARQLQEAGANTVSVSVESSSPGVHDTLRGEGSFARAVEGIRILRAHAPRVRIGINYLVTAVNYRDMSAMIPFAESLGVHQIKFAPIHTNLLHKDKPLTKYRGLLFEDGNLDTLEEEVAALVRAMGNTSLQTTSLAFLRGISGRCRQPRRFLCYAGYATCAVDPQGFVAPCCDIGSSMNVLEAPLEVIWGSRAMDDLRRRVFSCRRGCWDTTNTELSLRMSLRSLLQDIPETWRDLRFYFGEEQ